MLWLALTLFACGDSASTATSTPEEAPPDRPLALPAAVAVPVAVAAEGSRFDPPVVVAQIPDGAWMCDMGTVHYAALEPGEGACPVCGMKLTQKAPSAEAHGDHDGHDHD